MSISRTYSIGGANLQWRNGNIPYSERFHDIYTSSSGALGEIDHVFLKGIGAPDIWYGNQNFTIAETGFGLGLNFLRTWANWKKSADKKARLHYVSIEGYPVTQGDLERGLSRFPELCYYRRELIRQFPPIHPGIHSLQFEDNRVFLTLFFGPIYKMISSLIANIDAWYLDGFAPSKNPEMWSIDVINEIARLSHRGTRLATFSVAAQVRRDLSTVGFKVDRVPGFGNKQQCLRGQFLGDDSKSGLLPYYGFQKPISNSSRIAVIGGGIAGAALSAALKSKGAHVIVYDKHVDIAMATSGNPAAILQPRLANPQTSLGRFQTDAYLDAFKKIQNIDDAFMGNLGVISVSRDIAFLQRHINWIDKNILPSDFGGVFGASDLSDAAGILIKSNGVFFPKAGTIDPRKICQYFLSDVDCKLNSNIMRLERTESEWILLSEDKIEEGRADAVILANGIEAVNLNSWCDTGLNAKRGQLSFVSPTKKSINLQRSITYGGYATPLHASSGLDYHILGATYDQEHNWSDSAWRDLKRKSHKRNLALFSKREIGLEEIFGTQVISGRASLRTTTSDHVPVIGPLFLASAYQNVYDGVRHGKSAVSYPDASELNSPKSIYMFNGFGSTGFSMASHAANILVAQMFGLPIPAHREIVEAVHPARFLIRMLKRHRPDNNYED